MPSVATCSRQNCRSPLPAGAQFCPRCGQLQVNSAARVGAAAYYQFPMPPVAVAPPINRMSARPAPAAAYNKPPRTRKSSGGAWVLCIVGIIAVRGVVMMSNHLTPTTPNYNVIPSTPRYTSPPYSPPAYTPPVYTPSRYTPPEPPRYTPDPPHYVVPTPGRGYSPGHR